MASHGPFRISRWPENAQAGRGVWVKAVKGLAICYNERQTAQRHGESEMVYEHPVRT